MKNWNRGNKQTTTTHCVKKNQIYRQKRAPHCKSFSFLFSRFSFADRKKLEASESLVTCRPRRGRHSVAVKGRGRLRVISAHGSCHLVSLKHGWSATTTSTSTAWSHTAWPSAIPLLTWWAWSTSRGHRSPRSTAVSGGASTFLRYHILKKEKKNISITRTTTWVMYIIVNLPQKVSLGEEHRQEFDAWFGFDGDLLP